MTSPKVKRPPRFHNDEEFCTQGCGRRNSVNPVSLGPQQVQWLFRLAHEWGGQADHERMQLKGSIYATCSYLRYWGLTRNVEGARQGTFAITQKGYDFLAGEVAIEKTVWMFDGQIVDREGPMVTITDILSSDVYETYDEIVARIRATRRTAPRELLDENIARNAGPAGPLDLDEDW